jgi:uncharacterized protein
LWAGRSEAWFPSSNRGSLERTAATALFQCAAAMLGRASTHLPVTKEIAMPAMLASPYVLPILMLLGSNIFMTLAWYGHLRFKEAPLITVIFAAWGIALVEYCLAVPANRWGNAFYTTAQLKTMQEVITLVVFVGFAVFYLKEPLGWNHALGFALIALGAFFVFQKW